MPDQQKTSPAGAPFVPDELGEQFRVAAADPAKAPDVRLRLAVEGGTAAERYEYRFEASASLAMACELHCRMTQRDGRAPSDRIARGDFARLAKAVDIPALLQSAHPLIRIPPDSLVGRLDVYGGERQASFFFMADPGQAESAGYEMPAELAKLVDEVYAVSEKYLRSESIKSARP